MEQYPPLAFTQLRWIRYWRVPRVTLYRDPLDAVEVVPKVHAHLSAFSAPRESYQAFRSGSVTDSSSSCPMMDAMPSAPALLFGLTVCHAQADGQRSGLPTNEYLMSLPPI